MTFTNGNFVRSAGQPDMNRDTAVGRSMLVAAVAAAAVEHNMLAAAVAANSKRIAVVVEHSRLVAGPVSSTEGAPSWPSHPSAELPRDTLAGIVADIAVDTDFVEQHCVERGRNWSSPLAGL